MKCSCSGRQSKSCGLWFRYNSMKAVWYGKVCAFLRFGLNSSQTADTARVVPGRFQFQMHSLSLSSGALIPHPHVESALLETSCRETPRGVCVCVCARITPYHQLNRTVFSKNQLLITRGTSQGPASHARSLSPSCPFWVLYPSFFYFITVPNRLCIPPSLHAARRLFSGNTTAFQKRTVIRPHCARHAEL